MEINLLVQQKLALIWITQADRQCENFIQEKNKMIAQYKGAKVKLVFVFSGEQDFIENTRALLKVNACNV